MGFECGGQEKGRVCLVRKRVNRESGNLIICELSRHACGHIRNVAMDEPVLLESLE